MNRKIINHGLHVNSNNIFAHILLKMVFALLFSNNLNLVLLRKFPDFRALKSGICKIIGVIKNLAFNKGLVNNRPVM